MDKSAKNNESPEQDEELCRQISSKLNIMAVIDLIDRLNKIQAVEVCLTVDFRQRLKCVLADSTKPFATLARRSTSADIKHRLQELVLSLLRDKHAFIAAPYHQMLASFLEGLCVDSDTSLEICLAVQNEYDARKVVHAANCDMSENLVANEAILTTGLPKWTAKCRAKMNKCKKALEPLFEELEAGNGLLPAELLTNKKCAKFWEHTNEQLAQLQLAVDNQEITASTISDYNQLIDSLSTTLKVANIGKLIKAAKELRVYHRPSEPPPLIGQPTAEQAEQWQLGVDLLMQDYVAQDFTQSAALKSALIQIKRIYVRNAEKFYMLNGQLNAMWVSMGRAASAVGISRTSIKTPEIPKLFFDQEKFNELCMQFRPANMVDEGRINTRFANEVSINPDFINVA